MRDIPLTPVGGGGVCLSDVGMNPADIIVSTTNAAISGVIRADTGFRESCRRRWLTLLCRLHETP